MTPASILVLTDQFTGLDYAVRADTVRRIKPAPGIDGACWIWFDGEEREEVVRGAYPALLLQWRKGMGGKRAVVPADPSGIRLTPVMRDAVEVLKAWTPRHDPGPWPELGNALERLSESVAAAGGERVKVARADRRPSSEAPDPAPVG